MSTNSTPLDIDIPGFGKVPVQVNHGQDPKSPIDITHRPPIDSNDPRFEFKNERIELIGDGKSRLPQYGVRRQKILTVTESQLNRLLAEPGSDPLYVGVMELSGKDRIWRELKSISNERSSRITRMDCTDPDSDQLILLDWTEDDTTSRFPELVFGDSSGNVTELIPQENNYIVVSGRDGPNDPPATPPSAVGLLNNQPSDFRPASHEDLFHYSQNSRDRNKLGVAVIDTGLKFNLHNPDQDNGGQDPYLYRDADGQERPFMLAYQDQSVTDCISKDMVTNHLGYCALMHYRQHDFIQNMQLLPSQSVMAESYSSADVINSPFDDFRLFKDPEDKLPTLDARHGTFVTSIIQQNGDNAPVLPVKVFDNIGFATLFDVLNGFNYVLRRCQSSNIRVVNASWICGQNYPLIEKKIEQLMKAGVLVIAAAGNEGQTDDRNLDNVQVYPACYSTKYPNVITVTSVRKTYFRSDLLSPKEDTFIGKILSNAIGAGLFNLLESIDDIIGAILPTAGYVAVENYSTKYVNVGVVSTFGYFRSPFYQGPVIRGSSYACAFVTGFVIRKLQESSELRSLVESGLPDKIAEARQKLLEAMSEGRKDTNLEYEYVNGGYYLDGHAYD